MEALLLLLARSRSRIVPALVLAIFALTLVSSPMTPRARASASPVGRYVHHARVLEVTDTPELSTFLLKSVNTGESVTVAMWGDKPEPESLAQVNHLLRCLRTQKEHDIDPRLVTMLSRIAAKTGGEIELVSGFRAPKHSHDVNFHTRGMAADVRVPGMRAWELRKLANELGVPGLGYYPTTKMIHVDVRDVPYRWTDWSGPN